MSAKDTIPRLFTCQRHGGDLRITKAFCGALLEGFSFVGIEREADYFAIAQARIRAVPQQVDMFSQAIEATP